MSTRELAYSIFEQLTEEELLGFVALFRKAYPPKNDDMTERLKAFEELEMMRKHSIQMLLMITLLFLIGFISLTSYRVHGTISPPSSEQIAYSNSSSPSENFSECSWKSARI